MEGLILGTLVAGISWLAHLTHAAPYQLGYLVPYTSAKPSKPSKDGKPPR
jgi:hypothetical protein